MTDDPLPFDDALDERQVPVARALARATGHLSTTATSRMETDLPWFTQLSAEDRSWVGLIVHAGIKNFVDWLVTDTTTGSAPSGHTLASAVFGAAPRELTGVITLQQTVDLIRLSIDVVESDVDALVPAEHVPAVNNAVLRYGREVAFATAEVYARAAESRGAWDARLEALVVDAVLRAETDESLLSRASALGWRSPDGVTVVVGSAPRTAPHRSDNDVFTEVRRTARAAGMDALCGTQGTQLVIVLGRVSDPVAAAATVAHLFADGPVVAGPLAPGLARAHASAHAAAQGHRAAAGKTAVTRPVHADDLLAERVLVGDEAARTHLVEQVWRPLTARKELVETLVAWFESGGSTEGSARALFVHPNTVRYRLRQVAEVTGLTPAAPEDAFTLQVALVVGRQEDASASSDTHSTPSN
ncbi:PucR family transcriptional regulator [Nocardioides yefusunii]|uniref:PucR family transcriptional regulator n=1 Tax=Nocardioides yefusunii TaxID=2500546 RepID=A0ABW1QVY9_9ACTN|nr:helix-turn-helix domain-containing protein [Nocardioides yefusunii]